MANKTISCYVIIIMAIFLIKGTETAHGEFSLTVALNKCYVLTFQYWNCHQYYRQSLWGAFSSGETAAKFYGKPKELQFMHWHSFGRGIFHISLYGHQNSPGAKFRASVEAPPQAKTPDEFHRKANSDLKNILRVLLNICIEYELR